MCKLTPTKMKPSPKYPKLKADLWCLIFDISMAIGCAITVVTVFVAHTFHITQLWVTTCTYLGACLALVSLLAFGIAVLVRKYQRQKFVASCDGPKAQPFADVLDPEHLSVTVLYNDGEGRVLTPEEEQAFQEKFENTKDLLCEKLETTTHDVEIISNLIREAAARAKAHNATTHGPNGMAVSCMLIALIQTGYLSPKWYGDKKSTMDWLRLINGECISDDKHFLDYFHAQTPYPRNQQKLIEEFLQQISAVATVEM